MVFPFYIPLLAGLAIAAITTAIAHAFTSKEENYVYVNTPPKRRPDHNSSIYRIYPCDICSTVVTSADQWSLSCGHRCHETCLQKKLCIQIEEHCPVCYEKMHHETVAQKNW